MADSLIRTDQLLRERYSQGAGIYRLIPAAVARPTRGDELREVLRLAADRGLAVTSRGAGSAMTGSNVTTGLIVDLTAFEPARCLIDPEARRASLSPSIPLGTLDRLAASHALRFPVDPSSASWATLGGMVSTNAAGPHSVRRGSVRRWVREVVLETDAGPLLLTRGSEPDEAHPVVVRWRRDAEPLLRARAAEIRSAFPAVRKNSAGYALDHYLASGDLLDLVIGSEGTLGVLTHIVVDLEPVPRERASLRVAVRRRSDLVEVIERIRTHDPATLELLDASFLRVVADRLATPERPGLLHDAAGLLLADFEGDDRAVVVAAAEAAAGAVAGLALDTRVARDAAEIEALWTIRHAASPILAGLGAHRRSLQVIEDGCVPVARLAEYLDAIDAAASAAGIDAVMFGHAGDGHVHVNLLPDLAVAGWKDGVRAIFAAATDAVIRLGGTPSGEHGTGRLRAGMLERVYGRNVQDCFRAVKAAFDPAHRFNPAAILGTADPLADLKVGADAAPLSSGMERYLTDVEANARWGESRWLASR